MPDKIAVMPSGLVDLIAAGEVVERPASVVKELVENSIDAGAKHIYVELGFGGLKSISVKDDGSGMSNHDAKLCIKRHASSKIKSSFDLLDIHTMGFRGEAIPSIIAVAQVTIDTSDGLEGTRVFATGDKEPEFSSAPLRKGTIIKVEDLFYNTPARLKYMKSPQTEKAKCVDVLEHLALGFPSVAFDVRADGRQIFTTTGRGDVVEVIQKIYGNDIARSIMKIEKDAAYGFSFIGYLAKPEINYASRYQMMTFINHRFIYSYKLTKAIEEAYRDYLAPLRYPFAIIDIQADPALVDVNVHPSKKEVRISGEDSLAVQIREAILDVLKDKRPVYGDKDTQALLDKTFAPVAQPQIVVNPVEHKKPEPDLDYGNQILRGVSGIAYQGNPKEEVRQAVTHMDKVQAIHAEQKMEEKPQRAPTIYDNLYPLGQVAKTYIICDSPDGMYIMDQHAAAERVNFEKFQSLFESNIETIQPLEPVIVELPPSVVSSFDESKAAILKKMGMEVEQFGPNSLKLSSLPRFIASKDYSEVIKDIIIQAAEGNQADPLALMRKAVSTLACKASVRAGDELSPFAQVALIRHLAECRNPANCPHGRPTAIKISIAELEKLFKRTGF